MGGHLGHLFLTLQILRSQIYGSRGGPKICDRDRGWVGNTNYPTSYDLRSRWARAHLLAQRAKG
jgi:hypothetical protein